MAAGLHVQLLSCCSDKNTRSFFSHPLVTASIVSGLGCWLCGYFCQVFFFFCVRTPHFWERGGTAAAGGSPGSLRAGAGGGSVLDGQCDSREYLAADAGSANTPVLSLALSFIQAFAATNHHRVEKLQQKGGKYGIKTLSDVVVVKGAASAKWSRITF